MKNVNNAATNETTKTINPAMAEAFAKADVKPVIDGEVVKPVINEEVQMKAKDLNIEEVNLNVVDVDNSGEEPVIVVEVEVKKVSMAKRILKMASGPVTAGLIAGVGAMVKNASDRSEAESDEVTGGHLARVAGYTLAGFVTQAAIDRLTPVGKTTGARAVSSLMVGTSIGGVAAVGLNNIMDAVKSKLIDLETETMIEEVLVEQELRG